MSKSNTMESAQLTDAMYYILLSLMIERHGYAIMKHHHGSGNTVYSAEEAVQGGMDSADLCYCGSDEEISDYRYRQTGAAA